MSIGVVIITFCRPHLLREALKSIQRQERQPDDVLISDNSPHPDHGIASEFADLPIRYHFHKNPLPIDAHWLWAIQNSQSDLVALLEDDNLFRPNHLACLAECLESFPSAVLAGSNSLVFSSQNSSASLPVFSPIWKVDVLMMNPELISRDLGLTTYLLGSPFASSAIMFRRSALNGLDLHCSGLRIAHDRWMWAQIAQRGDIVYHPAITMLYRDHPVQVVKNFKRPAHRYDSLRCTRLIFDLIIKLGIDVEKVIPDYFSNYNIPDRVRLGYLVFRLRDPYLYKKLIPLLLPDLSKAARLKEFFSCFLVSRLFAYKR